MPDMTLQEALQTDEVKTFLGGMIREAVDDALDGDAIKAVVTEAIGDAVKTAVDEQIPTIRESVREEFAAGTELEALHTEAVRLIEASPLKGAAKANLLEDYGLTDEGDKPKPGRALALIEAERDDAGKVVKTAKQVLRDAVDEDVKRQRNILREAAPSIPRAPGGGNEGDPAPATFGGEDSAWAQRMRDKGMDPSQFGATPKPEPATT